MEIIIIKNCPPNPTIFLVKEKCTKWNDGERCLYLPLKNIPIEIIISRKHGTPEKANIDTDKAKYLP